MFERSHRDVSLTFTPPTSGPQKSIPSKKSINVILASSLAKSLAILSNRHQPRSAQVVYESMSLGFSAWGTDGHRIKKKKDLPEECPLLPSFDSRFADLSISLNFKPFTAFVEDMGCFTAVCWAAVIPTQK